MIASRKLAAVAFAGGATLALLAGCAQAPSTYSQPESSLYYDPGLAAAQMHRDYLDQLNAWRRQQQQFEVEPDSAPVAQAPSRPRRFRVHRAAADDGPVIAEPGPTPAPVPQTSNRPECVGWWRLCHFL
jgi:hypothetical protein